MLSFSAGYNVLSVRLANGRVVEVLRRLDHAAIYVKIAGTYTPYAVLTGGPVGWWLLIGVWTTAAIGTLGKLIAPNRWQRLSIVLYLALGWCFVMVSDEITAVITTATLVLIAVGGVLYTVGVIFHLWQSLRFQTAIWHGFVLVATIFFYAALMVEISSTSWAGSGKI